MHNKLVNKGLPQSTSTEACHPNETLSPSPHLGQQAVQLFLEVAVLIFEHLVLGERHLQAHLQRLQVLLLLLPGERGRLAVLDHPLLPLAHLGLRGGGGEEKEKEKERERNCFHILELISYFLPGHVRYGMAGVLVVV